MRWARTILPETATGGGFFKKNCSYKFCNIQRKIPVLESINNK